MSARRHFSDSSDSRPSSNLAGRVEKDFVAEGWAGSQDDSSVTALRSQLALEYRLQSLCQRLLESYKDQLDWAAVGQVAQSLVTNSQRVSLLKERLLSGKHTSHARSPHRLHSITEQPSDSGKPFDAQSQPLLISSEAEDETQETGTESGSESSETFEEKDTILPQQCFDSHSRREPTATESVDINSGSGSGASSPIDYETASQQTTSEAEPETSTAGFETAPATKAAEDSISLVDIPSTTPSQEQCTTISSSGCSANSIDTLQQLEPNPTLIITCEGQQEDSSDKSGISSPSPQEERKEEVEPTSQEEANVIESPMEALNGEEVGGTSVGNAGAMDMTLDMTEILSCLCGDVTGVKREEGERVEEGVMEGDSEGRNGDLNEGHREDVTGAKREEGERVEEGVMEGDSNETEGRNGDLNEGYGEDLNVNGCGEGGERESENGGAEGTKIGSTCSSNGCATSGDDEPSQDVNGGTGFLQLCGDERAHASSCPPDDHEEIHGLCESLSPPRIMALSGSDSYLNKSFSETHRNSADDATLTAAMDMDKSMSQDDLDKTSTTSNRKRQSSIPSFVSRQTKGLRKSTRKLVKQMGSMKIRRAGRGSMDATGKGTTVMTLSPIRGQDWDPTCLLEELYSDYRRVARSSIVENARHSGYLEKLPVAQTKKNILKGYKRRYFRAIDGNLYYYEERLSERALGFLKLENCKLSIIPEKLQLHLTENSGKVLVMRAPNHVELCDWHRALQLESVHPTTVLSGAAIEENPVIIIDIGACSVRVGLAGEDAYPELFFPSVCSVDSGTEEFNDCGLEALLPENRFGAKLVYPRRNTAQMSRNSSTTNQAIVDIVDTVLNHYNLQAYQCSLLMTVPHTAPETERAELAEALLSTVFQFQGILFQEQALLSLYSYNTTAGVVVDIGDHIDIVPVIDGYSIEGAICRLPFGGNAITEYLTKLLTASGIRYFSETETYINRYIKEGACIVSLNYVEDCKNCESKPALYSHQINVDRFQLPDHRKAIVIDDARFKATEGLFTPGLWGKDVTGLHDLVWKAIQACPIDQRKLMLRNIYLSGGTTLIPGLRERLKAEISALAPAGSTVEVHASDNRQHATFLGAAVLARLTSFRQSVVTQEEWNAKGPDALNKWSS